MIAIIDLCHAPFSVRAGGAGMVLPGNAGHFAPSRTVSAGRRPLVADGMSMHVLTGRKCPGRPDVMRRPRAPRGRGARIANLERAGDVSLLQVIES